MIPLLWAALAADLGLIWIAAGAGTPSAPLGAIRAGLPGLSSLLIAASLLIGALTYASWPDRRHLAFTLGAMVFVVVFVGVAVTRGATRIHPLSDIALIELYTRKALTGELLVGPYSRFGWHHPGPLYFYLMAPIYALAGQQPAALAVGAVALTTAAVTLLAWVMARAFQSTMTLALMASIALYLWRLPDLVSSAWNPHIVIVPTTAAIVVAAVLASGDLLMLPILALLVSFVAQTDVALVPVMMAVTVMACARGLGPVAGRGELRRHANLLGITALMVAGSWLATFVEELTYAPGNLTLLWRFFVASPGEGQPFGIALAGWAKMLAAPFHELSLPMPDTPGQSMAIALGQLLAVSIVAAWAARRSDRALASLGAFCLLASAVALWSATRIEERIMDHQLFWVSAIGTLNLGIICGAAALQLGRLRGGALRLVETAAPAVCGALIASVAVTGFTQLERARTGVLPVTHADPAALQFATRLRDYLRANGATKPLFRIAEGEPVWGMVAGIILELDRAGVAVAVEESWMPMFPQTYAATGSEGVEITASDPATAAAVAARPGNLALAHSETVHFDAIPIAPGGGR